jgi:predicted enzyme involved in methoxymalonyl-ACP biosynthesis
MKFVADLLSCCTVRAAPRSRFAGQATYAAAYWGYVVPAHLLSLAAGVMHHGKLILVLDLDETLLLAYTADSLAKVIHRTRASR